MSLEVHLAIEDDDGVCYVVRHPFTVGPYIARDIREALAEAQEGILRTIGKDLMASEPRVYYGWPVERGS